MKVGNSRSRKGGKKEELEIGMLEEGEPRRAFLHLCVIFEMKPGEEFPDLLYLLGLGDQPNLGLGPVLLGLRL